MKLLFSIIVLGLAVLTGCGSDSHSETAHAPSGKDCAENIAYLQGGVDAYSEALGTYPADVDQLLDKVDGKGPFIERVPACPAGNIYEIENGAVTEAPAR